MTPSFRIVHARMLPAGLLGVCFLSLWACVRPGGARSAPTTSPEAHAEALETIALGSCARNGQPQPVWTAIRAHAPDLFVFLGDNVYADRDGTPRGAAQIAAAYAELEAEPGWRELRAACGVLATWDDHDYGKNDGGAEWELKEVSQKLFLDFFGVPEDSPRRRRAGVYHAQLFGPPARRVQVILLDTRSHRGPLRKRSSAVQGRGPYLPNPDSTATLLGDAQWAWLEDQLRIPARVRILCSSIQVLPEEHGWESWANLPHERRRLFDLIARTGADGVVIVSGDRHLIELSCDRSDERPYPLWELTTSGLNQASGEVDEPNRYRVGEPRRCTNFGLIHIDWEAGSLILEGRDADNSVILSRVIPLGELTPGPP